MKKQDANHHVRYYVPHHFVLYPLLFLLLIIGAIEIYRNPANNTGWKLFMVLVAISGWIAYMMRQHYALTLQNRVVRLEMRLRYYQLTGKRLDPLEDRLSFHQIAALRFSSDEELPSLLDKTLEQNLAPAEIKKQILKWKADHMRV